MTPTMFPEANLNLVKPEDWKEGECQPLPAWRGVTDGGHHPQIISCWRPTPEEIADIVAGKPVWLGVVAEFHPPVYLTTENPFAIGDLLAGG